MPKTALEKLGLVHSWNGKTKGLKNTKQILDTSLRDGLQDPTITQPTTDQKLRLITLLAKVGVDAADIGFPVSSVKHKKDVIEIAKHIKRKKLPIKACALARTQIPDIEAIIDVSQKAQIPMEAIIIVGSSKVRHFVEGWDLAQIEKWIKQAIKLAVDNNIEANFLTEDGTRTEPEIIKRLYSLAVECGATRVTLADTVGAITLGGTRKIVKFLKEKVINDESVGIDWHGHNDRDLGTANNIIALESGADRVHTTVLGIGERAGNSALEPTIFNMQMLGYSEKNIAAVQELAEYGSKIFHVPIPENCPGIGRYVHSTSVGIHASAIMKARHMNREDLANTVYSGVDAQLFGRKTEILVGPLSGKANVQYVLEKNGIKPTAEITKKILNYAQTENAVLKDEEVLRLAKNFGNN